MCAEPARNDEILGKRVRRLLHLDRTFRSGDELAAVVLPFLKSLGKVALIGGAIRDVARGGIAAFSSDLDFVIHSSDNSEFKRAVVSRGAASNKFGGYRLDQFRCKVDVWHIDDTWAKTAGFVNVATPADLLQCTFFDWDSVIFDLGAGHLVLPPDYFEKLRLGVMDIRLEENPNPVGSLVRALRRGALWGVKFGPRLTEFAQRWLTTTPWAELVSLDNRAFSSPVLKHLEPKAILSNLETRCEGAPDGVTLPVSNWARQLALPFSEKGTSLSPILA